MSRNTHDAIAAVLLLTLFIVGMLFVTEMARAW